jgi:hypothetical protein
MCHSIDPDDSLTTWCRPEIRPQTHDRKTYGVCDVGVLVGHGIAPAGSQCRSEFLVAGVSGSQGRPAPWR